MFGVEHENTFAMQKNALKVPLKVQNCNLRIVAKEKIVQCLEKARPRVSTVQHDYLSVCFPTFDLLFILPRLSFVTSAMEAPYSGLVAIYWGPPSAQALPRKLDLPTRFFNTITAVYAD